MLSKVELSLLAPLCFLLVSVFAVAEPLDADGRKFERVSELAEEGGSLVARRSSVDDTVAGLNMLNKALEHGSAHAASQLAFMYRRGIAVAIDGEKSRQLYEYASAQGEPIALLDYGSLLYHGMFFDADKERGTALLERAAHLGVNIAALLLADERDKSEDSVDQEYARALRADVGEDNLEPTRAAVALLFRFGQLVPVNKEQESYWLEKIAAEAIPSMLSGAVTFYSDSQHVRTNHSGAADVYEEYIAFGDSDLINNYSWLLATSYADSIRNGSSAVRLMERMLANEEPNGIWLDTLAAAYAEAGDFENAALFQSRAIDLFSAEELESGSIEERLLLYEEGVPWRE